jgi:hypothetical protein
MSTRAQLRFTDRAGTVQVYNHSDGYPEGVVRLLDIVTAVQDSTGTERGAHYTAANYIFLGKLTGMQMYAQEGGFSGDLTNETLEGVAGEPKKALESLDQPHFLLGYGVENPSSGLHGDEQWTYEYDLSRGRLRIARAENAWSSPYEFEGTLDKAVEEYL